jgi:hypothetical protein
MRISWTCALLAGVLAVAAPPAAGADEILSVANRAG